MPMNAATLAAAIKADLPTAILNAQDAAMVALGLPTPASSNLRTAMATATANAIADVVAAKVVAHIQANATVTVNPVVAAGIAVTVAFPAGTGATVATGTSADAAGTISQWRHCS